MANSTIPYVYADTGTLSPTAGITAERARYNRSERVVVIGFTFTVGTAISDTAAVLFTGAPPAVSPTRTHLTQYNAQNGTNIRVEVDQSGNIRNAYTQGGIPAGNYEGELTYICQ